MCEHTTVDLYIYFNGASTSPFAACSFNNKGLKEEVIITTINSRHFSNVFFSSDTFDVVAVVAA